MKVSNRGFKVRECSATISVGVALDFSRKQYDVSVTAYADDGSRLELRLTEAEVAQILEAETRRKELQKIYDGRSA